MERCLLNFEWMFIKMKVGIQEMFTEYQTFAESPLLSMESDVQLFCQLLELCYDAFKYDPNMFASHIIERLRTYTAARPGLQKLVDDASMWIGQTKASLLLPAHDLQLLGLDSPLRYSANNIYLIYNQRYFKIYLWGYHSSLFCLASPLEATS